MPTPRQAIYRKIGALTTPFGIFPDSAFWRKCRMRHLRHRFAVQTLVGWYRQKQDPMRLLPVLATYLGHGHVTDTYWYLTNTPELLTAAGQRLEKRWKGLA
jgi:hypothetical protein